MAHEILEGNASADYELAFVWNRTSSKIREDPKISPDLILENLADFPDRKADLIIEVSHPSIIADWGDKFLQHADFLAGSPTAFASSEVEERLRKAAEDRAERLLLSVLSDEQRRDWTASGHFFLHVGDRKYRIGRTRHGGLSLVDGNNQEIENLCVQVRDDVPAADNALAQLFLLKHDEEHIVRTANVSRLRPGHASLKTLLNEGRLRKAA